MKPATIVQESLQECLSFRHYGGMFSAATFPLFPFGAKLLFSVISLLY
ncbi:hypothetical protein B4064_0281 [Caldibacillus thermoamylovorans]|nr:hypothetical protein B4064_0281 [Caldibacillus thermoamylovorans]